MSIAEVSRVTELKQRLAKLEERVETLAQAIAGLVEEMKRNREASNTLHLRKSANG